MRSAVRLVTFSTAVPARATPLLNATPAADAGEDIPPLEQRPGQLDNQRFQLHSSVARWESWRPFLKESLDVSPLEALRASLDRLREAGAFSDAIGMQYWAYHLARMGFFATQGVASVALSSLAGVDTERVVGFSLTTPRKAGVPLTTLVSEAASMFKQDLECVRAGEYRLPWDMSTPGHRQRNPVYMARKAVEYFQEATGVLGRRERGKPEDVWLDSDMYPDYYRQTYHFQTDGWMSSRSASVYETSTETLFLGRQDAMQRMTLVPMRAGAEEVAREGRAMDVLEVGCGTGRFATFVRDNHPTACVTMLDLSPFYLEEARKNHENWERTRGAEERNQGTRVGTARFVQGKAESLPFPHASLDIVTSTYMLHEIPLHARVPFFKEASRVLRPNGRLIVNDSIQLGDRPDRDARIGRFGDFNEPWYRDYVRTDLGQLGLDAGLTPETKMLGSASKCLSFRKPGGEL